MFLAILFHSDSEFTLPVLYHKVLQVHIKCWLCTIELMKFRKLTRMSKGPFIIYVQGGRDFEEGHIFGKSPIGGAYIWQILDGGALFWQCRYMKSLRNPLFSVFWAKIKLNKYCSICFQEGGHLFLATLIGGATYFWLGSQTNISPPHSAHK